MNILHLCSYYIGSEVYKRLFASLARKKGINEQYVFIATRDKSHYNKNALNLANVFLVYVKCLCLLTRLFFFVKQVSLISVFLIKYKSKIVEGNIELVHAHTLYSDGILAFWLSKLFGIPFVITVRGTDINIFNKILPHWGFIVDKVLNDAKGIVFLSKKHQASLCEKYPQITNKKHFIVSGLDDYWLDNGIKKKSENNSEILKGIYVGTINKNKNLKKAIYAFFLSEINLSSIFIVVGGTYEDYKTVYGELESCYRDKVTFMGKVENKNVIRRFLRTSNILVMPSTSETLGLSYLEAISQCTPVVYTREQGIDGLFPEGSVGFSCDSRDVKSIASAITKTINKFPNGIIFSDKENPINNFSWDKYSDYLIANVYQHSDRSKV